MSCNFWIGQTYELFLMFIYGSWGINDLYSCLEERTKMGWFMKVIEVISGVYCDKFVSTW